MKQYNYYIKNPDTHFEVISFREPIGSRFPIAKLVELKSANGCMRSVNAGFQRKLHVLERMNMQKTGHFQTFGAPKGFLCF